MTGKEIARRAGSRPTANRDGSLRSWAEEAEAAAGIARALVGTPFIPDSLCRYRDREKRDLDVDATTAVTTATLLAGQELGFSPMASLSSIDVIKGRPGMRALALRALVQAHGHAIWVAESTETRAIVRGRRNGTDEVQESAWTLDKARKARLYPAAAGTPWQAYTASMLVARATADCARMIAADAILGMPYVIEELEYPDAADETARDADGDTAARPKRTARRKTPARPALPAAIPAQPGPADEADTRPATPDQLKKLHTMFRDHGLSDRDDGLMFISDTIGRHAGSTKELTRDDVQKVFARLDDMPPPEPADDVPPPPDDEGA